MSAFNTFFYNNSKLISILIDFLLLILISTLALLVRDNIFLLNTLNKSNFFFFLAIPFALFFIFDVYDFDIRKNNLKIFYTFAVACVFSLLTTILFNYLTYSDRSGLNGRGILLFTYSCFFILGSIVRFFFFKYLTSYFKNLKFLFIGNTKSLKAIEDDFELERFNAQAYYICNDDYKNSLMNFKFFGDFSKIESALTKKWYAVVLATDQFDFSDKYHELFFNSKSQGQYVINLSSFYENIWKKVPLYFLKYEWIYDSQGFNILLNPVGQRVKRLLDILLSFILLLISAPIMLFLYLIIRLDHQGSSIYRQTRTGLDGKVFTIYKFRSMRSDSEKDGAQWAQKNDQRITQIGHFIRKTRLDELPQLFNVIKGDMSFIGPRPERPEFNIDLEKEIPFYNLRHSIKPGITGWAQINYPYGASLKDSLEKTQYDLFYIKHHSFIIDIIIVIKTISVVLFGKGR